MGVGHDLHHDTGVLVLITLDKTVSRHPRRSGKGQHSATAHGAG
jgi:hypothetical protein